MRAGLVLPLCLVAASAPLSGQQQSAQPAPRLSAPRAPNADSALRAFDSTYSRQRQRLLRSGILGRVLDTTRAEEINPHIISIGPPSAPPGDHVLIVLGNSRLDAASATAHVHFDSLEVKGEVIDSITIDVTVPAMASGSLPAISVVGKGWVTPSYYGFTVAPSFQPPRPARLSSSGGWIILFGVVLVGVLAAGWVYFTLQRRKFQRISETSSRAHGEQVDKLLLRIEQQFGQTETEAERLFTTDVEAFTPEVPPELVDAVARGECVLFAGPGVSVDSGYPTRLQLLASLITRLDDATASRVRRALEGADPNAAADIIAGRLPRAKLLALLQEAYGEGNPTPGKLHQRLSQLAFSSAFTTNFDDLLEKAFAERNPVVLSIANASSMSEALKPDQFVVVRLYGDLTSHESFLFVPDELQAALFHNPTFAKLLITELSSKTWLFVGASIDGIAGLLSAVPERQLGGRTHYALVPFRRDWELQEDRLRARSIRLLGFTPTAGFPEVLTFVDSLISQVKERRGKAPTQELASPRTARLRNVSLSNIGPFRELDLDFNSQWTVILGNNGSGKSTVLRALALAFCGDDIGARAAAERLLRIGETNGSIEMTFDDVVYRTYLTRDLSGVAVKSAQFTPVQRSTAAVMGFPPLRGFSVRDPVGAAPTGSSQASIADVLPLLTSAVDTRMDSLKQWLVNIEVNSQENGDVTAAQAAKYGKLRDHFFTVVRELSPGTQVRFGKLDRRTWKVFVETPDGSVHLDQVSQGMSSLLGWVGTSLQRMYEIWPDVELPEHCPAIFLVDEVDAHLHPEWQQVLVRLLSKHFPNAQFIATTHSPLVVAGMKPQEVLIARRDDLDATQISVTHAPMELEGLRADQLLTSPLFGLATTRSLGTLTDIDRLSMLAGKTKLTDGERMELAKLEDKVNAIVTVGETPLQRRIEDAVRKAVDEALSTTDVPQPAALSAAAQLEMRRQLNELFDSQPTSTS